MRSQSRPPQQYFINKIRSNGPVHLNLAESIATEALAASDTLASMAIGWLVGWVIQLDIISPEIWIPQHVAFEMNSFLAGKAMDFEYRYLNFPCK